MMSSSHDADTGITHSTWESGGRRHPQTGFPHGPECLPHDQRSKTSDQPQSSSLAAAVIGRLASWAFPGGSPQCPRPSCTVIDELSDDPLSQSDAFSVLEISKCAAVQGPYAFGIRPLFCFYCYSGQRHRGPICILFWHAALVCTRRLIQDGKLISSGWLSGASSRPCAWGCSAPALGSLTAVAPGLPALLQAP